MKDNIVKEKSFDFAVLSTIVCMEMIKQNEFVLSKQLLRSSTSIGANVEEALAAYSKKDFASKMSIASKEARESNYWIRVILAAKVFDVQQLIAPSEEMIRLLTAIVKSTQSNIMKR